jgi:methyltransferase-like protein/SAM-dependent methyltransferase
MPEPTSYDDVLYDSQARYPAHPDSLATLATLLGLTPAHPAKCRYLEIGCANGGHLLPLAEALPESTFVGIDQSEKQLESPRQVAAALGLNNVRFEVADLRTYAPPAGSFDYVSAHGVYSWVAPQVRDDLLALIRRVLAPQGVAYISYNTYPGWYLRAGVRDLMRYHTRRMSLPYERITAAREVFRVLREAQTPDSAWAAVLDEEAAAVEKQPDFYLYHEHLAEQNGAVYFRDFVEHARRHGLQYLGEAGKRYGADTLSPELREKFLESSDDLIELEQYVDFLKNRSFRRTLVVPQEATIRRETSVDLLSALYLSGQAQPVSDTPDLHSPLVTEEFRNEDDVRIETNKPIVKLALSLLHHLWPRPLPFPEVVRTVRDQLGADAPSPEDAAALLAQSAVPLYLASLIGLHVHVPPFALHLTPRTKTTKLIALQARTGARVINRRHREVELLPQDRLILGLLDMERSRDALLDEATRLALAGALEIKRGDEEVRDPAVVRQVLERELDDVYQRLASAALLVD